MSRVSGATIVFVILIAAGAFPAAARAECSLENVASAEEIAAGWTIHEDHRIVKRTWVRDWHRVENAMMRFGLEATQLQRAGWVEVSNTV